MKITIQRRCVYYRAKQYNINGYIFKCINKPYLSMDLASNLICIKIDREMNNIYLICIVYLSKIII